ncbi:hypothetical protein [Kistimonas asteriae]|uniref:hypothetical protein n=1 Tax=Kistimonas asteriae TaxID=517724 RepID=UPI001BA8AC2E|nr:hypothetical protein [Kistimonas asteriae]
MSCISLKGVFSCCQDPATGQINKQIKRTVFGRTVFRITYPLRRLISDIVMTTYEFTRDIAKEAWLSMEDRGIAVIMVPCVFLAGVMGFSFGLAFGAIGGALTLLPSVYWAFRSEIDELDTSLEKYLMTPRPWQDLYEPIESTAPETPPSAAGTSQ